MSRPVAMTAPSGSEMTPTSSSPIPENHLLTPAPSTLDSDLIGFHADSPRSIVTALCAALVVSDHDNICSTLCAELDQVMSDDSVSLLRGREFTVKRLSSGALESDWQLVFGAQVEKDKDGNDEVECYQASSRTYRFFTVRSLENNNVKLFQGMQLPAAAADSTARIPPLYRAELLYMLACQ